MIRFIAWPSTSFQLAVTPCELTGASDTSIFDCAQLVKVLHCCRRSGRCLVIQFLQDIGQGSAHSEAGPRIVDGCFARADPDMKKLQMTREQAGGG